MSNNDEWVHPKIPNKIICTIVIAIILVGVIVGRIFNCDWMFSCVIVMFPLILFITVGMLIQESYIKKEK